MEELQQSMLVWINSFGFVHRHHLAKRFSFTGSKNDHVIDCMINSGLLIETKLLHDTPAMIYLSKAGAKHSDTNLSAIKKINLSKYQHDITLVDISFALEAEAKGIFIPERTMRKAKKINGVGHKGHVSDGELITPQKKIAIELEFSAKGKQRRQSIIRSYLRNIYYDELWYIYKDQYIYKQLQPLVAKMDFIKLKALSEL